MAVGIDSIYKEILFYKDNALAEKQPFQGKTRSIDSAGFGRILCVFRC